MASQDETFMGIALILARRGLGRVWPNPAVGAVLVAGSNEIPEVIARGWTMPGGRPHGEVIALERAGERARGATLYVTLEPCAHHGQTPPCADAVIAASVARVVCAIADPDPRVSGQGLESLKAAGIEVAEGILAGDAERVTRGHLLRVTEGRPEVTLKLAVGADGLIAPGEGAPVWVSGEQARARGHLLRARADAILVGRGTVEADDPELTCRLPGMEDRSPVRVVLDSNLAMARDAKLLRDAGTTPVWICCAPNAPDQRRKKLAAAGAEIVAMETGSDGRLDIIAVLRTLAERGITRLLVEGGPNIARSFLETGMIDRAVLFRGGDPVGPKGLRPFVSDGLERIEEANEFYIETSRPVGPDKMTVYEKNLRTVA